MLRPEPMSRALIVGPRDRLAQTIETLHELKLLHIVEHHEGESGFSIGKPLPTAGELSYSLVRLRSVAAILGVEKAAKSEQERLQLQELHARVMALELNISEEDSTRKKTQALLADLTRRIEELRPFAALGLPLDLYRGYENLTVLVGRVARDVVGFEEAVPRGQLFQAPGIAAAFLATRDADAASGFLGRSGFSPVNVPAEGGNPKALLDAAVADEEKWRARLKDVEGRLAKLREKYAGFVVAAEEALEVEVEKAEAPLRFAVSEHSFVIDGWVPAALHARLVSRLSGLGVFVESSEPEDGHGPAAEPPVLLKNPRPAKPFEFLIHLYSTPSYHELDPTVFILVAFPFFFGFMIGDAGYGALFLLIGVLAVRKLPKTSDLRNLLIVIAIGGFWALIFGLFLYGEMFGMPFHLAPEAHPEALAWDKFGVNYPLTALIHKEFGLADMIYLSILFAFLHLGASFLIGVVNNVRHNKKHAAAKLGWFLCLFGLFTIFSRTLAWTGTANWVYTRILSPVVDAGGILPILGYGIPAVSLGLVLAAVLGFGESPVAPLEIGGLVANMISYARLAGIGVGKAAIATAFNTLILTSLVIDHDVPMAALGLVLLVFSQLLVFALGGISAGIQGLRLNYVESFTKFFKGNGIRFVPFGTRKPQEA